MTEDYDNINNNDLSTSSMFDSEASGGDFASIFSGGEETKQDEFNQPTELPQPQDIAEKPLESAETQNSAEEHNETKMPEEKSIYLESAEDESETMKSQNPEISEKKPLEVIDDSEDDDFAETEPQDVVTVRPVKFKKFEATPPIRTIKKNLDIMQDISMHISVELGRTKLSIKEVMDFEKGSIVELNKIAGEQVEVFVNGKLVAKGEVIVIEDRFGVRVTSTNIIKNTVNP